MKKITDRTKNEFLGCYLGKVEDRSDPLQIGRLRIRVFSLHTEELVTSKLPWFLPAYPVTASQNGSIGDSGIPELGSTVVVQFVEGNICQGIYTHTVPGKNDLPNPSTYLNGTGNRNIKTPSGHLITITDKLVSIVQDDTKTTIEISDGTINIKAPSGKVNVEAKEVFIQDSTEEGDFIINHQEFIKAFESHRHPTAQGPTSNVIPGHGLSLNSKWYTKSIKVKK
jgi:hypothetical protein